MIPVISANKRAKRGVSYNFAQANGALAGFEYTNSAWTVASNKALSTPTLGAELFLNGTFAADTNWTKGTGWTISGGTGNKAAGTAGTISQTVATANNWYKLLWDVTVTASTFGATLGGATNFGKTFSATQAGIVSAKYTIGTGLGYRGLTATSAGSIDNASAKAITISDMFATLSGLKTSATLSVNATIPQDTPTGIVGWLDSHTSPANYILCFHNGETLTLIKVVAGVITSLINTAATYAAGAEIKMKGLRSGANLLVTAYYNGVQIGTQQTVSDAGIVDNTRHGIFSSNENNTISRFTVR